MNDVLEKEMIQKDGSLYSLGWYLSWPVGDERATLDGEFTAEELRAIADHMDEQTAARNAPKDASKVV